MICTKCHHGTNCYAELTLEVRERFVNEHAPHNPKWARRWRRLIAEAKVAKLEGKPHWLLLQPRVIA